MVVWYQGEVLLCTYTCTCTSSLYCPSPRIHRSEFGQTVAKEYLKCFEFDGKTLDEAIRLFLANFSLTGESQERERVMVHFSEQYHENNPGAFLSAGELNPHFKYTCGCNVKMRKNYSSLYIHKDECEM